MWMKNVGSERFLFSLLDEEMVAGCGDSSIIATGLVERGPAVPDFPNSGDNGEAPQPAITLRTSHRASFQSSHVSRPLRDCRFRF
jgi:hypothetical protein